MVKHICDICGKEAGSSGLYVLNTGYKTGMINDLCRNCQDTLDDFMVIIRKEHLKLMEQKVQHFLIKSRIKLFKEEE